jgi:hypothetical protein
MPGTLVQLRWLEHKPLCRASTSFSGTEGKDVDGRDLRREDGASRLLPAMTGVIQFHTITL